MQKRSDQTSNHVLDSAEEFMYWCGILPNAKVSQPYATRGCGIASTDTLREQVDTTRKGANTKELLQYDSEKQKEGKKK